MDFLNLKKIVVDFDHRSILYLPNKNGKKIPGLIKGSKMPFANCPTKNRQFGRGLCFLNASGQIITTSADVTLNGGLIRELPQNPLNSGLGIILICPDAYI